MNNLQSTRLLVLIAALVLAGCSQGPAPATNDATVAADADAPASGVAAANAGTMEPRYAATLAEGFDFTKPGGPDFLLAASGLSGVESWGRWTDANLGPVVFRFRDPLPQSFTLKLKVRDYFGLNAAQQITVRAGAQEQHFVLDGKDGQMVELKFAGVDNVDTLELVVPKTSGANGADSRKIGLGLISMSISG